MAIRYGILLHDDKTSFWGKMARSAAAAWNWVVRGGKPQVAPPETAAMSISPSKTKGDIKLPDAWVDFVKDINNKAGFKFIQIPHNGWYNKNKKADTIGFGGGWVQILDDRDNDYYKIAAYNVRQDPPVVPKKLKTGAYAAKFPHLIHRFVTISRTGNVAKPGKGYDVFVPLVSYTGYLYVEKSRVRLV